MEAEIELFNLRKEYREKDEMGIPMSIRERYRNRLDELKEEVRNKSHEKELGQLLVKTGLITGEQLTDALAEQEDSREDKLLGDILVDNGFITRDQLRQGLKRQTGLESAEPEKPERSKEAPEVI